MEKDLSKPVDMFLEHVAGTSPSDCYVVCGIDTIGVPTPLEAGNFQAARAFLIAEICRLMTAYHSLTVIPYEEFKKAQTIH